MLKKFVSRISKNTWLAVLIAVGSLVPRVWNLNNALLFLGDQGRDALTVANMFRDLDPVFIGPVTSIGNMYLGPAYYYFMLPFLLISYPSPIGPAYAVALLSAVTVFCMYYWGRSIVGEKAGLVAAFLLATHAVVIDHSRFSWNPNPAPFVSLLVLWSVWRAWQGAYKFWLLAAVGISVLLQLHYVAALAGVAAAVVWLIQLGQAYRTKKGVASLMYVGLGMAAIIIVSFTPLILFDLKHGGINAKGFWSMIQNDESFGQGSLSEQLDRGVVRLGGRSRQLLAEAQIGQNQRPLENLVVWTLVLSAALVLYLQYKRGSWKKNGAWLLIVFVGIGVAGVSAYRHDVYFHYILFLIPFVLLYLAWLLSLMLRWRLGLIVVLLVLGLFAWQNSARLNFEPTGPTIAQFEYSAEQIHAALDENEPYVLVLLAAHRDLYGMNYRYFLSVDKHRAPLSPERFPEATTLVIINEEGIPDPTSLPIYEIAVFGVTEPSERITIARDVEVLIVRKDSN